MKKTYLLLAALFAVASTHAATTTVFWDINGTTSIGGNGTWNTTKEFSTNSAQVPTANLVAWNDNANYIACFSAGPTSSGSQGSLTITVNRTNICSGLDNGVDGPGSCFLTIVGGSSGQLSLSGTVNTGGATQGATTINIPVVGSNGITFNGPWTCTLNGTNLYTGATTVTNGTLALGAKASISNSSLITVAPGGILDVSAITNFNLSASNSFRAQSGSPMPNIIGGTTVNFGSRPITLTSDGTHPSLTIGQGTLSLNGNAFTINKTVPLTAGDHTLITQSNGTVNASGTFTVGGSGIVAGSTTTISVVGGNVILTITNIPTTTTVTTVSNAMYGSPVTLTASISPAPAAGGTVQFYDNGVALGGPVTVSGTNAVLTTNGLSVGDHPITATFSGSAGYLTSTTGNAVDLTILPANNTPGNITSVTRQPDGSVAMNFSGGANGTYLIQYTADLNPPAQWTNISTNMADTNGLFQYTDTNASGTGNRFYRTQAQ